MNNIANEDIEVGAEEDSGEENEEEAEELNTRRVQRRVEEWKKRVQKERKMASEELSEAPVGESEAATGEDGDTFRAAIEVSCKVFWRVYGFWLPEARPAVRGNAGFHSSWYARVLLGDFGGFARDYEVEEQTNVEADEWSADPESLFVPADNTTEAALPSESGEYEDVSLEHPL